MDGAARARQELTKLEQDLNLGSLISVEVGLGSFFDLPVNVKDPSLAMGQVMR